MPVGIVGIGRNGESRFLRTAAGAHRLHLGVLLRDKGRGREFAKLHLCLDAKQSRATTNERRTGGHAHIAGLEILDNLVFLAFIGKLQVLVVKLKGGIGIVSHVEFHLVAHRGCYGGLDLLLEVEISFFTRRDREGGIIGFVHFHAHVDCSRPLGFQLHAARAEDGIERPEAKLHVEKIEGRLLAGRVGSHGIFLPVILYHRLAQGRVVVLVAVEQEGGDHIVVAYLGVHHIHPRCRVILDSGGDIVGVLQVGGLLHKPEVAVVVSHLVGYWLTELDRVFRRFLLVYTHWRDRWRSDLRLELGILCKALDSACKTHEHHAEQGEDMYVFSK